MTQTEEERGKKHSPVRGVMLLSYTTIHHFPPFPWASGGWARAVEIRFIGDSFIAIVIKAKLTTRDVCVCVTVTY